MKLDACYALRTVADDPALAGAIQALIERAWPAYIQETSAAGVYTGLDWMGVYTRWPGFTVVAMPVPLYWASFSSLTP